jgi:hypothetical protein
MHHRICKLHAHTNTYHQSYTSRSKDKAQWDDSKGKCPSSGKMGQIYTFQSFPLTKVASHSSIGLLWNAPFRLFIAYGFFCWTFSSYTSKSYRQLSSQQFLLCYEEATKVSAYRLPNRWNLTQIMRNDLEQDENWYDRTQFSNLLKDTIRSLL